jgi:hypothetical protein
MGHSPLSPKSGSRIGVGGTLPDFGRSQTAQDFEDFELSDPDRPNGFGLVSPGGIGTIGKIRKAQRAGIPCAGKKRTGRP